MPRSLFLAATALIAALPAAGQVPAKCLEIESVLVDACNSSCAGAQEGENEMFRFITGPAPVPLAGLTAQWATVNAFLGWVQDASTASVTAQLNATVTGCGWLIEPPNGVIPAGRRVLGITSTNVCITGNSFAGLDDTLYVIYQAPGNTFGHFKNTNNGSAITSWPSGGSSFRTFILRVGACSDSVTYNESLLVNQLGSYGGSGALNDGSTVEASWPGAPQLTYVNHGCQAPVTPLAAEIVTVPDPVACGASVPLQAATTGQVASTHWSGGTGSFSASTGLSTVYTLGPGDAGGALLLFCAVSLCGDTICDQMLIPIEAPPVPALGAVPDSIACGGQAVLSGTVTGNAVSTFWSGGQGTWADGTGLSTVYSPGPAEAGTINLSFCAVGACGDTVCAPFTLAIAGAPPADIAAQGPTLFCAGSTVDLTASGGTAYAWSTGATTATITVGDAGTYTVTAITACGQAQASIAIEVLPLPVAMAAGPASSCPGQPFTLEASGGDSYLWSTGAAQAEAAVDQPGLYTVTVSNACGSDTASVSVAPGQALAPAFTADLAEGCAPLCVHFTAAPLDGAIYAWAFSDGGTAEGPAPGHCFEAGLHGAALTAAPSAGSALCPATIALDSIIRAWPEPVAAFTASPWVTTTEQPEVRFTDGSSGADSLRWSFGEGEGASTERDPAWTYGSTGCFTVRLVATSIHGCTGSAEGEVCVEAPFGLWVPNAITPNADGINDGFRAVTTVAAPQAFELLVFDRWGRLAFRGDRPDDEWDASGAPDGLYAWRLRITDTLGKRHERTGHVTVLR